MNKSDLVDEIANESGVQKKMVQSVVDLLFGKVEMALLSGGEVSLHGFGTFRLRNVASRVGRNVRTGESIDIPEHRKVVFKPAKALKDALL